MFQNFNFLPCFDINLFIYFYNSWNIGLDQSKHKLETKTQNTCFSFLYCLKLIFVYTCKHHQARTQEGEISIPLRQMVTSVSYTHLTELLPVITET